MRRRHELHVPRDERPSPTGMAQGVLVSRPSLCFIALFFVSFLRLVLGRNRVHAWATGYVPPCSSEQFPLIS